MAETEYRLFFNNQPATREQLDLVEEIVVDQEIDTAWEARLEIPIEADEHGNWTGEDEDFISAFTQIRLELKIGESDFQPLIDGPLVRVEHPMQSTPGQSAMILYVQDDSIHMDRDEAVERYEDMRDHEIAEQLFRECDRISSTDIEDTPSPEGVLPPVAVRRSTPIRFLRSLARRQGLHAYVLPGTRPGQSIGCFRSLPLRSDGLPAMILLGAERNIESFEVNNRQAQPAATRAATLEITDKQEVDTRSETAHIERLGNGSTLDGNENSTTRLLPPRHGTNANIHRQANAETERASYAIEASGSIRSGCYSGILSPYRLICVRGANRRLSGMYLINSVTHTLNRSEYSQSFSLLRNARSETTDQGRLTHSARGIF